VPYGRDALGLEPQLTLLSELAVHAGTEAPLTIGLLGGPGSGKSFALERLVQATQDLSVAARSAEASPFLSNVLTLRVNATSLGADPSVGLAAALYARLRTTYPALAQEAAHAVRDPRLIAREASEKLDEARRRLDDGRQTLADINGRLAQLPETLVNEPGARVDSYARTHRARIEKRLANLGFSGDLTGGYKDLVRDFALAPGGSRLSFLARALWSCKGQARLIILALVLIAAGWGIGLAVTERASWLNALRTSQESLAPAANWIDAHIGWFSLAQKTAYYAAAVALLANLWRAFGFLQPVWRGASLLQTDLETRRRELDSLLAHQTRRVDALAASVDAAAKRADEAERRVEQREPAAGAAAVEPSPFDSTSTAHQTQEFFTTLDRLVSAHGQLGAIRIEVPQRIVVALDELDALRPDHAWDVLDKAHQAFNRPGFVTLIVADSERLQAKDTDGERLEKYIQIPFRIAALQRTGTYAALAQQLIGRAPQGAEAAKAQKSPDARTSVLDKPLSDVEAQLVTELAPLAGKSPRALKRFVNLYRLLRIEAPDLAAEIALMLALDAGGTPAEIEALGEALATPQREGEIAVPVPYGGHRLADALQAVHTAGAKLTSETASRAAALAQVFSFKA
jgi:hypothetical protein